jgi:DNA-binding GntR family transcriptional regulator
MVIGDKKSPPTTTGYVMDYIREGIYNGRYPLGSRLDQKAIAEELGVSIVPIREAVRLLEGDGIINLYPRRGAFVTNITADGLEELYMIRQALEELATRLAVPNLTEARLAEMAEIIQKMEEATSSRDFVLLLNLNRAFHFTIYEASALPLLMEMIKGLWNRSALYRRAFTFLPERAVQALQEHKQIYQACRRRDGQAAGAAVKLNIRQTVEALLEELLHTGDLVI